MSTKNSIPDDYYYQTQEDSEPQMELPDEFFEQADAEYMINQNK